MFNKKLTEIPGRSGEKIVYGNMNAAPFFELENAEKMKKNILFMILLVFAGTAVFLNLTQSPDYDPDMKYMSMRSEPKSDTYQVDVSRSELSWTGRKLTGNHTGTVYLKSGSLVMDKGDLVKGSFVIDMTSMQNDDIEDADSRAKLMGHLRSDDFFGTASYPDAKVVIKDVEPGDSDNVYDVTADLIIKNTTNTITFPATLQEINGKVEATADITFDRTKWNVRYGSGSIFKSLGDKTIYDDIDMSVKLVATK